MNPSMSNAEKENEKEDSRSKKNDTVSETNASIDNNMFNHDSISNGFFLENYQSKRNHAALENIQINVRR